MVLEMHLKIMRGVMKNLVTLVKKVLICLEMKETLLVKEHTYLT